MKTAILSQAHTLSVAHVLNRKVVHLRMDKQTGEFLACIEISGYINDVEDDRMDTHYRTETSYFSVAGEGLNEMDASAILIARATYSFLGAEGPLEETVKEVKTAKAKKAVKTESKQSEEKPTPKAKAAAKKAAPKAAKTVAYDRTIDAHKKQFAQILNEVCPGWQKDATHKSTAKTLSEDLNGSPFLDSKGSVMKSFTEVIEETFAETDGADL